MVKSDLFVVDEDGVLVSFFDEAIDEKGILAIPEGVRQILRPLSQLIIPSDSSKKIKVLILPKSLTFFSNALYKNSNTKLVIFNSVVTFDYGFPVFLKSVVEEVILPEGYSVFMSYGCPFLEPFQECDTIKQVTTYTTENQDPDDMEDWNLFEEYKDDDGREYFINTLSGEMTPKTPEELRISRVHLSSLEEAQNYVNGRIEDIINDRQRLPIQPI